MWTEDDQVLVVFEKYVALLSSDDLYWRISDGSWLRTPLRRPISVEIKGPPQHTLLTNRSLFLGYNRGEFGGGLVYIPVETNSTNPLGPSKLLSSMNVKAIVI
jgi:hypothetical protein